MTSSHSCAVVSRRRSSHNGPSDAQDETRGRRARPPPCRAPRQIFGISIAIFFEAAGAYSVPKTP
jgi:hypothetical protein